MTDSIELYNEINDLDHYEMDYTRWYSQVTCAATHLTTKGTRHLRHFQKDFNHTGQDLLKKEEADPQFFYNLSQLYFSFGELTLSSLFLEKTIV